MSSCSGDGGCLKYCDCKCYDDEEMEVPSENCRCGHREHRDDHPKFYSGGEENDVFCREDCSHNCELIKCRFYELCNTKAQKYYLNIRDGMCGLCHYKYGTITETDEIADCPICYDDKYMILTKCNHKFCLDCWKGSCEAVQNVSSASVCPLCRTSKW